jgi:hypothetical protein
MARISPTSVDNGFEAMSAHPALTRLSPQFSLICIVDFVAE